MSLRHALKYWAGCMHLEDIVYLVNCNLFVQFDIVKGVSSIRLSSQEH